MLTEKENEMWDCLVDFGIATSEEIGLVCAINGVNTQSFINILYVRTGYNNFEQFLKEEIEEN